MCGRLHNLWDALCAICSVAGMSNPLVPPPTNRLRLRPYVGTDEDFVIDLFNDRYAEKFYPSMASSETARGWIDWNLRDYESHGFGLGVVENNETGHAMGDCGPTVQDVGGTSMTEVGYHIFDGERGRGYATEAAGACVANALDDLGLPVVGSIIDPQTDASIRVSEQIHAVRSSFVNQRGKPMLLFRTREGDRR
jgi:RimJ/RimL family protein N-acetyltransferase